MFTPRSRPGSRSYAAQQLQRGGDRRAGTPAAIATATERVSALPTASSSLTGASFDRLAAQADHVRQLLRGQHELIPGRRVRGDFWPSAVQVAVRSVSTRGCANPAADGDEPGSGTKRTEAVDRWSKNEGGRVLRGRSGLTPSAGMSALFLLWVRHAALNLSCGARPTGPLCGCSRAHLGSTCTNNCTGSLDAQRPRSASVSRRRTTACPARPSRGPLVHVGTLGRLPSRSAVRIRGTAFIACSALSGSIRPVSASRISSRLVTCHRCSGR